METGNCLCPSEGKSDKRRWRPGRSKVGWSRICAGVAFAVAFTCAAQEGPPAAAQATGAPGPTEARSSVQQPGVQRTAAADTERKKQISDESTQLLAMAIALKAEVDKTNKDMLSLNVIRKADEIERLARTVKARIKQSSGPGSAGPGTK